MAYQIKTLVILLLVLNTNTSSSQSIFDKYSRILENKGVALSESSVDSLINNSLFIDSILPTIEIVHDYSLKQYFDGNYRLGLKYVIMEKELYEKNGLYDENYIKVIFNAGLFTFNNLEFKRSMTFFDEVIEKDTFNFRTKNAYFELGRVNYKLGDYKKSVDYFNKRIKIFEAEEDYLGLISGLINISSSYSSMRKYEFSKKAIESLIMAENLSRKHQISPLRYLNLQNALAYEYTSEFNYDFEKAKEYNFNCLSLGEKYGDSTVIGRAYTNLSYLFNKEKNDSAKFFIDIGLKYTKSFIEARARLYDNLADYHIIQEEFQDASKSIQNSLELISRSKIVDLPTNYQISQSILIDYMLYCLKKKAEIELRLNRVSPQDSQLKHVVLTVQRAEYALHLLLNGTSEQSTQFLWRREASQAYLYGAYASHLLGDSNQAFSFMEKNKALLLSESVLKNTEFANLPRHISQQETAFQKQIYELENKLSEDEDNSDLLDSLFLAKRTHENYIDSLKTVYPKYFARKINVDQIPLPEVQKELGDDKAVLSYIWNDFDRDTELILGLAAANNHAITFEIKKTEELREKLNLYRKLISKPFATKEEQRLFQNVAHELYAILLPNQEVQDLIVGKNLTIIPDGDLQNIPFESLITKRNSYDYLILNGDINYSYSHSFLKHNEKVHRKTKQTFIGYSPSNFNKLSLSNLINSKQELMNINSQFKGIAKLQDNATKDDFLSNSSDAKIIHLATHADVGKNPWIAFSDEKLQLHELYTYKNNADLVTLSACNTSLGELAKGEGVLSLARGFFYSGSKSVVSSLWSVNDQSTSEIMTNFYANLGDGQTKSEALNNAKRSYLANHTLSELSPYYWSSFVLIGDSGTIHLRSNLYLYFLLGLFGIVLVLFFRKKIKISG